MVKMMEIGQTILGRYSIDDLISEGGQARVAKGTDQNTGQAVAIKQLAASPGDPHHKVELDRFKLTGRLRIGHPNVVDPFDFGEEDDEWYLIMPFVDGMNLADHVARNGGTLPADLATSIAVDVAQGLAAAHALGVVHRDIKPHNIMVGTDTQARIVDFGICRMQGRKTLTTGPGLLGSLEYMSPEQAQNASIVDLRTDLYSLGAVWYFMLTGSPPVSGQTIESIAVSICQRVPPSPRQHDSLIPIRVDQACMRLLAKRPEGRFQSAEEFIQAVHGVPQPANGDFCFACGEPVATTYKYCHRCGVALQARPNEPARCLACGAMAGDAPVCPGCSRTFSHADHRLQFVSGSLTAAAFRIPEGHYVVGRQQLSARDCHISRRHFWVSCSDGSVVVQDAGSTNKTFVAGLPGDVPTQLVQGHELYVAGNTATYTQT